MMARPPRKPDGKINWGRLTEIGERHPIFSVLSVIALLMTIITATGPCVSIVRSYYTATLAWRNTEEQVINSLSASISIDRFQEVLGSHLFYRESEDGYFEYVFKRRGYWVQAITDKQRSVLLYAVTSCDESFKPLVSNPVESIRLRDTKYNEVSTRHWVTVHQNLHGGTANSYYFEEYYGGNPSNYQTILYGDNDACPNNLSQNDLRKYYVDNKFQIDLEDKEMDQFRANTSFNTFAITAPHVETKRVLGKFQIGIDRIQVRVYLGK